MAERSHPKARRKMLELYGTSLQHRDDRWVSHWSMAGLKNFYLEYLLFHEIGHHVDRHLRHWSKANRRVLEEAANQYAFGKTTKRSILFRAEDT